MDIFAKENLASDEYQIWFWIDKMLSSTIESDAIK
jgi:hypothetical protein